MPPEKPKPPEPDRVENTAILKRALAESGWRVEEDGIALIQSGSTQIIRPKADRRKG